MNSDNSHQKRNNLVIEVEALEQKSNTAIFFLKGALKKQIDIKSTELLKEISGPSPFEFEEYLKSKQGFIEDLALTYIGGQRSTEGVIKDVGEAVKVDLQQAIWERGMHFATGSLKKDSLKYEVLKNAKNFFAKVLGEPENPWVQFFQNRIDALPNVFEQVQMDNRLAQLDSLRRQFGQGQISQKQLVQYEKKWLESLHKSFNIAYELSWKNTPAGIRDTNALRCLEQTMVHGYALMRAFGVYSVNFYEHASVMVEKSDGSYTHFDNSRGPITHIAVDKLSPYSIENGLRNNLIKPKFEPDLKIPGRGKVDSIEYFIEGALGTAWGNMPRVQSENDDNLELTSLDPSLWRYIGQRGNPVYQPGFIRMNDSKGRKAVELSQGIEDDTWIRNIAYHLNSQEKRIILKQAWDKGKEVETALELAKVVPDSEAKTYLGQALLYTAQTRPYYLSITHGSSTDLIDRYKEKSTPEEQKKIFSQALKVTKDYLRKQGGNSHAERTIALLSQELDRLNKAA